MMYCIGLYIVLVVVLLQYSAVQASRHYLVNIDGSVEKTVAGGNITHGIEIPVIPTCKDYNGNIRQPWMVWKEQIHCNGCECKCGTEGTKTCVCTKEECKCRDYMGNIKHPQEEWMDRSAIFNCVCRTSGNQDCPGVEHTNNTSSITCKDYNGNNRQPGTKWIELHACNGCSCSCGQNGEPDCFCSLTECPCRDQKGNERQISEKWEWGQFNCTCIQTGDPDCDLTPINK